MAGRKRSGQIDCQWEIEIVDLNHKINRKMMLDRLASAYWHEANSWHYDNWMKEDECKEKALRYEEMFEETLRTPVGGRVSRYA